MLGTDATIFYHSVVLFTHPHIPHAHTLTMATTLWKHPRSIRDIRGEDFLHFKGKLDKVLSHYPDVSRCGTSGHSYNEHYRKSNSLCDHYRVREIRALVDKVKI